MIQSPGAKNEVIDLLDPHLHPLTVIKQGLHHFNKHSCLENVQVGGTPRSLGCSNSEVPRGWRIKGSPAGGGGLLRHCILGPRLDSLWQPPFPWSFLPHLKWVSEITPPERGRLTSSLRFYPIQWGRSLGIILSHELSHYLSVQADSFICIILSKTSLNFYLFDISQLHGLSASSFPCLSPIQCGYRVPMSCSEPNIFPKQFCPF